MNGRPFTVVGVAAPGFAGPELGVAADAWLPAGAARIASPARAAALLLSRQVFGLRAGDVGSFLAESLVLAGIAATAALLPGRRAATIHPLDALRLD